MPNGGDLRISVRERRDWQLKRRGISVSIVDTGVGVNPQDSGKLFEPFFSTKSTKGTGLGLWISKGIVQKYEGRISFRSFRGRKRMQHLLPCVSSQHRELQPDRKLRRRVGLASIRGQFQ